MEFIYPSFLWALLALVIPIIIHLFYFRRYKKVYFTNVNLLKEIKDETSTRNKLKDLLILLSRLFAITALVFAFAQPFIPQGSEVKVGNSAVSIFIDNSFSMDAEKEDVPLLDIAKAKAEQIVSAYSEQDRFQIITHDFEGRHQRLISKDDAILFIDEISITPSVKTIEQVIQRQKQTIGDQEDNEVIYILSDFQKSIMELPSVLDTITEINFLPIQPVQESNITIDTAWLESLVPIINQNNQLIVRITNHSDDIAESIRLTSSIHGQEKPEGTFDIGAGKSVLDTINLSVQQPGNLEVKLKVTDFPVQFDDEYYIVLNVPEAINVLSIYDGQKNRYLDALFNGLNFYNLTNQSSNNVDYSKMPDYDLIILNDISNITSGLSSQLDKYVVNGGNLLIFPDHQVDIDNYNNFLSNLSVDVLGDRNSRENTVKYINTDEFIFKDVYQYIGQNISLPQTQVDYSISNFQNRGQESLMRFRDGKTFLAKYTKNGHIYLCASPLDPESSDLVLKAEVFVPMIYKMAIASSKGQKIAYTIGKDNFIEVGKTESSELVYKLSGKEEFIPGQKNLGEKVILNINNEITEAGYMDILLDHKEVGKIAFNYDRTESDLSLLLGDELQENSSVIGAQILDTNINEDFSKFIAEKEKGVPLWKWFLWAALIFLLIEVLLLRFWKKT